MDGTAWTKKGQDKLVVYLRMVWWAIVTCVWGLGFDDGGACVGR